MQQRSDVGRQSRIEMRVLNNLFNMSMNKRCSLEGYKNGYKLSFTRHKVILFTTNARVFPTFLALG